MTLGGSLKTGKLHLHALKGVKLQVKQQMQKAMMISLVAEEKVPTAMSARIANQTILPIISVAISSVC